jgi:hypothetical protein
MSSVKCFGLILIIFLTVSCSHYVRNSEGYIRPPANYKFSYRKKAAKLTDTNIIDTTAIYYLHDSNFLRGSDEYKHHDRYIRFYSNGRVRIQGLRSAPKIEDVNNINTGLIGYYKLHGRVVKIQLYTDINAGSDQLEFGIIDENGDLVIPQENPRSAFGIGYSEKGIKNKIETSSYNNPKVYRKTHLDGMTYQQPDW